MGKKLSANELQQHNDRLLEGKENKVNSLIEKLESQKEKLAPDKHSIIDWGINFLHGKALEDKAREISMAEEFVQFKTKVASIMRNYQGLDGSDESVKDKIYIDGTKLLQSIATDAFSKNNKYVIGQQVDSYKNNLYSYYENNSLNPTQLYKEMISDLSYAIDNFTSNADYDYAEYLLQVKDSLLT